MSTSSGSPNRGCPTPKRRKMEAKSVVFHFLIAELNGIGAEEQYESNRHIRTQVLRLLASKECIMCRNGANASKLTRNDAHIDQRHFLRFFSSTESNSPLKIDLGSLFSMYYKRCVRIRYFRSPFTKTTTNTIMTVRLYFLGIGFQVRPNIT